LPSLSSSLGASLLLDFLILSSPQPSVHLYDDQSVPKDNKRKNILQWVKHWGLELRSLTKGSLKLMLELLNSDMPASKTGGPPPLIKTSLASLLHLVWGASSV